MVTLTPNRYSSMSNPRSTKRRRVMTQTKLPKALMPEMKQFVSSVSLTTGANTAYAVIPTLMASGTDGTQFVGSKFRIMRVRVYYDYTDVTITKGVRMVFGIPKDPSSAPLISTATSTNSILPINLRGGTLLKEKFLKTDNSDLNGYFEWSGPLNVEMSESGTFVFKNALIFQVNSDGVGAALALNTRTRIEVLFTG